MLRFPACCVAAALTTSLCAAPLRFDSLKVGASTYHNVTILGANTTDLYFTCDQGIANVKLKYLEPGLQERFHFDPKTAQAAERRQVADDAHFNDSIAQNLAAQAVKAIEAARQAATTSEDSLADPVSNKSLLNKPAPPLEVEKWIGNKPATDGKFVLVAFWTTWSIPCRKAIPEFNAYHKTFGDRLVVIGLCAQPETDVAEFSDPKIEFFMATDSKSKLADAVGVTSVPYALLVDPKGIVRYVGHPGALNERKLGQLLAGTAE